MMAEELRVPKHSFHLLRNMVDRYRSFFHPSVIQSGYKVQDPHSLLTLRQSFNCRHITREDEGLQMPQQRLSIGLERFSS
jgi:hypothetical protein